MSILAKQLTSALAPLMALASAGKRTGSELALVPVNLASNSRAKKKKKNRKRKSRSGENGEHAFSTKASSINKDKILISSAPSTFGSSFTSQKSFSEMSFGAAQKIADFGTGSSLRVSGRCFGDTMGHSGQNGGWGTAFASQYYVHPLSPGWISTVAGSRIETIESLFAYYCVRSYIVHYVTAVASTATAVLFMSVSNDFDNGYALATPTAQQIMEYAPNGFTSLWQSKNNVLNYKNNGTKLFVTGSGDSEYNDEKYQAAVFAMQTGTASGNIPYGFTIVEYVVDFYGDSLSVSSVSARKPSRSSIPLTNVTEEPVIVNPSECTTPASLPVLACGQVIQDRSGSSGFSLGSSTTVQSSHLSKVI